MVKTGLVPREGPKRPPGRAGSLPREACRHKEARVVAGACRWGVEVAVAAAGLDTRASAIKPGGYILMSPRS